MKGHHVYEHVVNVGETFECLPEAVNLRDANAVTLRSASSIVIGHFLSTCAIRVCSKHEMAKWLKLSRNNTWRKNEMTKWRNGEMTQSSLSQFFFHFPFVTSCSHMTLLVPRVSPLSRASWFSKRCQIVSVSASRCSKIYISRAPGMECMSLGVIWVSHARLIENVGM